MSFPEWSYQPYFAVPNDKFTGQPGTDATQFIDYMPPEALPYLQDYNLFKDVEEEVREWFQPTRRAIEMLHDPKFDGFWALEPPVLSVHVRRGDNAYINPPGYHPLRPTAYYTDAINELGHASVAIFTDDIDWCRTTFGPDYYYFEGVARPKENEPDYATAPILDFLDVFAMASCASHVLSNSSYSWWGAFLSDDKSPIYPTNWYGQKLQMIDTSLMFPAAWQERSSPVNE